MILHLSLIIWKCYFLYFLLLNLTKYQGYFRKYWKQQQTHMLSSKIIILLGGFCNKAPMTNKVSLSVPNVVYYNVVIFMNGKDKHIPDFIIPPWSSYFYPQMGIWYTWKWKWNQAKIFKPGVSLDDTIKCILFDSC